MKEFLVNHDGKWTLRLLDSDTEENRYRVAVPSGAEIYVYFEEFDGHAFYKDGFSEVWHDDYWCDDMSDYIEYCKKEGIILWQRHTQPEELPFIDDKPKSLNDTYAEIEQVRQDVINNPNQKTIDAMREAESILSQKHSHYFKDVSDIEQMDVYEVLKRFEVTDPCLQHIVKKALCAGQRGHKDFKKDLQDILDTAVRAVDINK